MTRPTTRWKRVATVVPLALVSVVWTTHLSGGTTATVPGGSAATEPDAAEPTPLPDGSSVATDAVVPPASLSSPADVSAGDGRFTPVASTASTSDIPSVALAAYQRAETVINAADPSCGLSWQLVAAIGRVESDHGRFGGATLGTDGLATPAIVGPVLDGRNGTAIIRDSDAGQYDGDTTYDRAVGPMQFIPSTWSVVGVDADDDGVRNPLDIDDAALAAAVYLCSGTDDLSQAPGQRLAVFRYNHSQAYVDQVLAIMAGYLEGDYTAGPGPLLSARTTELEPLVPVAPPLSGVVGQPSGTPATGSTSPDAPAVPSAGGGIVDPAAPPVVVDPTAPPVPTDPTVPSLPTEPTDPAEPTDPPSDEPTEPEPTEPTEPAATEPEPASLTVEDATTYCTDELGLAGADLETCAATYSLPGDDTDEPVAPVTPVRDESAEG